MVAVPETAVERASVSVSSPLMTCRVLIATLAGFVRGVGGPREGGSR